MGIMMQAFYWDCPAIEGKPFQWWKHVESEVPKLAAAGFTALWLPPANKAANNISMGYDPYDFWDLGEFDQKGSVATWFGTRKELEDLIAAAHGAKWTGSAAGPSSRQRAASSRATRTVFTHCITRPGTP
jgi:alpha-amylase